MTAAEHAADAVRQFDRERYLTTLFAPREARAALWAVYAFNLELAKTRELREEIARAIRLQWWRDVVEAIYGGTALPPAPVAQALAQAVAERGIARPRLDALIDSYETESIEEISARLMQVALEVLGATDDVSMEAGRLVGLAYATGEQRYRNEARKLNPPKSAMPALLLRRGGRVSLPLLLALAAVSGRW